MTESPWPRTVGEALAVQDELRPLVQLDAPRRSFGLVAGLDVTYEDAQDGLTVAAVVVMDVARMTVVEQVTAKRRVAFPYVPGLLAFREIPALLDALAGLERTPDLLMCDGYGLAHPRRFGLACHLGVLTGLPAIGVAKTMFIGAYGTPGAGRGDHAPIVDDGEVVGAALRTRVGVKPVFVSQGHRVSLADAMEVTLACAPAYRLPEPIRRADRLSRDVLGSALRTESP